MKQPCTLGRDPSHSQAIRSHARLPFILSQVVLSSFIFPSDSPHNKISRIRLTSILPHSLKISRHSQIHFSFFFITPSPYAKGILHTIVFTPRSILKVSMSPPFPLPQDKVLKINVLSRNATQLLGTHIIHSQHKLT